MAKGSAFMGQIRGKLGNVVGSVLTDSNNKEKQMFRAYQPVVKNPRTVRQSDQRMVVSASSVFYSLFSEILDHSFQGQTPGAKCQARFMKLAMDQKNSPYTPKGYNKLVPGMYQISEGSLRSLEAVFAQVNDGSSDNYKKWIVAFPGLVFQTETDQAPTQVDLNNNTFLKENDQITFVVFMHDTNSNGDTSYYYLLHRIWVGQDLLSEQFLQWVDPNFYTDGYSIAGFGNLGFEGDTPVLVTDGQDIDAAGVIISRWDGKKWLRSDSTLTVSDAFFEKWYSDSQFEAALATFTSAGELANVDSARDDGYYLNSNGNVIITKLTTAFITTSDNQTLTLAAGIDESANRFVFVNSETQYLGHDWKPIAKSGSSGGYYTTSDFKLANTAIIMTTLKSKPTVPKAFPYVDVSGTTAATFSRASKRSASLAKRAEKMPEVIDPNVKNELKTPETKERK